MTVHERLESAAAFMAAGPWETARVALFGIPMDATTSYRPGARFGPARIREASYGLEEYSLALDRSLDEVPFADLGDVTLPLGDVPSSLEAIEAVAGAVWDAGRRPLAIGGEHLATLPLVRAAWARFPELAVIQFDAHADLREEYLGVRLSHACVMRRIAEFLPPARLWQLGIRSATREEAAFARERTRFHPFRVAEGAAAAAAELRGRPVYVTIDIDVLDPAYAPGTGTPEPGGVAPEELFSALRALSPLDIVGADVVEAAPTLDPAGTTAVVAAKIVRELLLSWFHSPGGPGGRNPGRPGAAEGGEDRGSH
ncbi:MAG: agmatinase [Firmicutes bacterium]|nr:agmatinase [Bacillota bacterium]